MTNLTAFVVILALRLLVPLAIPRYPLPAIIAALILDGVDQTIFQRFTALDLTGYQGYDKALDVYYLTIAYLSTLRNWDNLTAFNTSRFLLYYRLVGVVLFEFTQIRALLLVFPNTFEYFFIFYESVRLRWNPTRMGKALVLGAAVAIWIVIKLPQEWWIHIAQRDFTDTLRENLVLVPVLVVTVLALVVVGWWVMSHRCPPADRSLSFGVDSSTAEYRQLTGAVQRQSRGSINRGLVEKVALISIVSVIFSQILPDVKVTSLQLAVAVAVLIVSNTLVSEWLIRQGVGWETTLRQFGAMAMINTGLALAFMVILPMREGAIHIGNTLFFLLLITLLVTLYDRFRPYYLARLAEPAI